MNRRGLLKFLGIATTLPCVAEFCPAISASVLPVSPWMPMTLAAHQVLLLSSRTLSLEEIAWPDRYRPAIAAALSRRNIESPKSDHHSFVPGSDAIPQRGTP